MEEIESMNKTITSNETGNLKFPTTILQLQPASLTGGLYLILRKELTPVLLKLFYKLEVSFLYAIEKPKHANITKSNSITDVKNKLVVARGKGDRGSREIGEGG